MSALSQRTQHRRWAIGYVAADRDAPLQRVRLHVQRDCWSGTDVREQRLWLICTAAEVVCDGQAAETDGSVAPGPVVMDDDSALICDFGGARS
jgi:hypothetical protein